MIFFFPFGRCQRLRVDCRYHKQNSKITLKQIKLISDQIENSTKTKEMLETWGLGCAITITMILQKNKIINTEKRNKTIILIN